MRTSFSSSSDSPIGQALQHVLNCCEKLIAILKEEQDLLIHRGQDEWDVLLARKRGALQELSEAEKKWRSGSDAEPAADESLLDVQSNLVNALQEICTINRENASLLRHALYYNQSFMSLIQGFVDRNRSMVYGSKGKMESTLVQLLGKTI